MPSWRARSRGREFRSPQPTKKDLLRARPRGGFFVDGARGEVPGTCRVLVDARIPAVDAAPVRRLGVRRRSNDQIRPVLEVVPRAGVKADWQVLGSGQAGCLPGMGLVLPVRPQICSATERSTPVTEPFPDVSHDNFTQAVGGYGIRLGLGDADSSAAAFCCAKLNLSRLGGSDERNAER